jgi:hypothetical protein
MKLSCSFLTCPQIATIERNLLIMSNLYEERRPAGLAVKGLLLSLLINVALPLLLIYWLTGYIHLTEVTALSIASIVPVLYSVFEVIRERKLDLIALFFLLGILTNIVAVFLGGNARLLVIRESFFTGALGLCCFLSLLLPRPLMFYVGRQMIAGKDPERLARFNAGWQHPYARFVHRLITTVWGCAFIGEFIVRVFLALTLPVSLAYSLGSTILIIVLALTFTWTFAYIRYASRKGLRGQQPASPTANQQHEAHA